MAPILANSPIAPRAHPAALVDLFRGMLLRAWWTWLTAARPSADEVAEELAATHSAMSQLARLAVSDTP